MRLCLATDSHAPSGMGVHMLALADELDASDDELGVAEIAFAVRRDTPLHAAARARGHAVFDSGAEPAALERWLRRSGFDLVHVHAGIGWEGHAIAAAAHAAGIGVVRTEHLPCLLEDTASRTAFSAASANIALHIAVSDAVAASYRDSGLLRAPMVTVLNGIADPAPVDSRWARCERRGGRLLLLCVGRFEPQKNHAAILGAMAGLRDQGVAADLALVGDGPGRAALIADIRRLDLAGSVRLLGQRSDVAALMDAADLLIHASHFEGLPLALMEAMAARLPIVTLSAPGIAELVDAETAFIAPAGTGAALAATIADALRDPARRSAIADHAATRQGAQFTASRMAAETLAAYRSLPRNPASMSAPVTSTRIGFVGAGGIAARHLGVLDQMDDVAIVGVVDPDAARAADFADRCGARIFADAETMLAESAPDALFICVPPFAHGPAEEAALAAGVPFFVEKPIALDAGQARTIADRVAQTGLITAVGYHWRYLDTLDAVWAALAGRAPRLVSGYWLDSTPPPRWWWQHSLSGGQMTEQATHLVDLALYLLGDAEQVFGLAEHSQRDGFEGLDVATCSTASMRFSSGAIGNFAATCLLGWNHRVALHLFGDGFAVELNDREVMIDVGAGRPVTPSGSDPVWHQDRAFIDAVQGGENRIRCTYGDALRTLETVLAIGRSAASGQAVKLAQNAAVTAQERAA